MLSDLSLNKWTVDCFSWEGVVHKRRPRLRIIVLWTKYAQKISQRTTHQLTISSRIRLLWHENLLATPRWTLATPGNETDRFCSFRCVTTPSPGQIVTECHLIQVLSRLSVTHQHPCHKIALAKTEKVVGGLLLGSHQKLLHSPPAL